MRMAVALGMKEFGSIAPPKDVSERKLQVVLHVGVGVFVDGDCCGGVWAVYRAKTLADAAFMHILLHMHCDVVEPELAGR